MLVQNLFNNNVTIIIPTLNEASFIRKCLDSILAQTYPLDLLDIIIVDGGSNDDTLKFVNEAIASNSKIRIIHNQKRIQSAAFNLGVENSISPILIRMDAHALYDKDYVSLCVKHLIMNNTIGNVGGIWNIVPQDNSLIANANAILNKSTFGIGGASFRVGAKAGFTNTVPFGAFRRDVVETVGKMNEALPRGEDNEYNFRIIKSGYKIYFDPRIVSTYFARKTIKSSAKQMYSNGVSIGKLVTINYKIINFRHIVPFTFVLSLFILLMLSNVHILFLFLALLEIALYIVMNLFFSFRLALKHGFKYFIVLPILFSVVHFSYGIGTLVGIFKK